MTNYKILINKDNRLENSYYEEIVKPSLIPVETFKNNDTLYRVFHIEDKTTYLEKTTANKFTLLRNYAKDSNVILGITSGFLTFEQQMCKYEYFVSKRGKEFAEKSACLPGYSEHNTGLALDCDILLNNKWGGIALDNEGNINSEVAWLHTVLHKFGFILRYPQGKEHITKMKFEPWHIRYVGKDLAKYIYEEDITLEEYYKLNYNI